MARFNDLNFVAAAFQPYLQPGEQIRNIAFGVKQPSIALMIPLFILAVLPGVIATAMLTKEYLVALTDRRVIVLRFKGSKIQVQEVSEYALHNHPPVQASSGSVFAHLRIDDPARPFIAKFHRMGMPGNREQAMAIAAALSQPQPQPPYQQYPPQYQQQYQQYPQQQYPQPQQQSQQPQQPYQQPPPGRPQ
ncbi:MAG: hypothetical protein QOH25_1150 [Acidobacteriota bacterium]|jgi:hypothetical protein|nr:hypothetical protein [Acidobacteriota bacterium]